MSIEQNLSLETLPIGILHRVCDSLDAQTILFSLRNTCRRLKSVVDSYDRHILDFKSISRSDFQVLCRLVKPRHVISLTLSHDDQTLDQIPLFISLFGVRQLTR